MSKVFRIFVEKKKGNDIEAGQTLADLRDNVGLSALEDLRIINRNSFMRCRLLNYFVHGTIPQFICIFLSLSQIRLYFSALSSIRICYSYDS